MSTRGGRNWDIKILSRGNTADVHHQGEVGNESKSMMWMACFCKCSDENPIKKISNNKLNNYDRHIRETHTCFPFSLCLAHLNLEGKKQPSLGIIAGSHP